MSKMGQEVIRQEESGKLRHNNNQYEVIDRDFEAFWEALDTDHSEQRRQLALLEVKK